MIGIQHESHAVVISTLTDRYARYVPAVVFELLIHQLATLAQKLGSSQISPPCHTKLGDRPTQSAAPFLLNRK